MKVMLQVWKTDDDAETAGTWVLLRGWRWELGCRPLLLPLLMLVGETGGVWAAAIPAGK